MVNFHSISNLHKPQDFSCGGVTDFVNVSDKFRLGVDNTVLMLKERWQAAAGNVTVFVYGGAQHGTAIFPVPDRIIGATTKERNAKRSPTDNHLTPLLLAGSSLPAIVLIVSILPII
jgi:hypothetical protein